MSKRNLYARCILLHLYFMWEKISWAGNYSRNPCSCFKGTGNRLSLSKTSLRIRFWRLEIMHLKAHNLFVRQGCFFFHYYLATSTTNLIEFKFPQACYFMHMLRYTKWGLVFDNYQKCQRSLNTIYVDMANLTSENSVYGFVSLNDWGAQRNTEERTKNRAK